MRTSQEILKEIQSLNTRITNIQQSYYSASNKEYIVEKEMGKLTTKLTNLMCEYHLSLEEWEESEIDETVGTQFLISEFKQLVGDGSIGDEDGVAFYVTSKNKETNISVMPSWVLGNNIRPEFNYIIWYRNDEIDMYNDDFDGFDFEKMEEEF